MTEIPCMDDFVHKVSVLSDYLPNVTMQQINHQILHTWSCLPVVYMYIGNVLKASVNFEPPLV